MTSHSRSRCILIAGTLLLAAPVWAQGGTGEGSPIAYTPDPAFKAALGFAAFIFLVSVIRGGIDIAKGRREGAPKPTMFTHFSRWNAFVLALFNLIIIIVVLAGFIGDVRSLNNFVALPGLLALGQLLVVLMTWRKPEAKMMMKIVHTLLFICALITLPLFVVQ